MSTHDQAKKLASDITHAKGTVSWQIGQVVNALLEEAKKEQSESIALNALTPLQQKGGTGETNAVTYDDIRAIVGQIVAATEPTGRARFPAIG